MFNTTSALSLGIIPTPGMGEKEIVSITVRIDWQSYFHPFFLLAAFISAGPVALSLFFIFAALAGINSQLVFDRKTSTLTYSFEAPLVRRTSRIYPLSAINASVSGNEAGATVLRPIICAL
jgi:hypothetical protein